MPQKIPRLCRHKRSGRAYVTDPATGREIYLGAYGTPEADQAYHRWVHRFLARNADVPTGLPPHSAPTVSELVVAYLAWARLYYRKGGKLTNEVNTIEQVSRYVVDLFGPEPADDFGPAAFKAVRQRLIDLDLARGHINKQMQRVRRIWKWGVEHELVEPVTLHRLQAVAGLAAGRTAAREEEPMQPVPVEWVEATTRFLTPTLADMVWVQLYAAMRPSEVCMMRLCDIDRASEPWAYRPIVHKTQHFQCERIVWIGPRARRILQSRCPLEPGAWLFPTPRRPGRSPGRYTQASYRTAIQRTIRRLQTDCGPGLPSWSPLQLRHTAATLIRSRHGLDAAQTVLGHAEADTTQIYAARDAERAQRVVEELG